MSISKSLQKLINKMKNEEPKIPLSGGLSIEKRINEVTKVYPGSSMSQTKKN